MSPMPGQQLHQQRYAPLNPRVKRVPIATWPIIFLQENNKMNTNDSIEKNKQKKKTLYEFRSGDWLMLGGYQ